MSTLEKSLVVNSVSTMVWVMDPSLFDGYGISFDIFAGKNIPDG
jgi:hypothetical protein